MAWTPDGSMSSGRLDDDRRTLGGGPHGLGDPEDKFLRKVETEVLIPKKLRDKARTEKCVDVVQDFNKCCKESGLSMVVKCQPENRKLKECLTYWFHNEEFKALCREEYLKERSEYRRTGITKKQRAAEENTFHN